MKILVCIYTCKQDNPFLESFKSTSFFQYLKSNDKFQIIEVYGGSNTSFVHNDKLLLECPEEYKSLSIKTYEMINQCVKHFEFDHLIKIDCNVFDHDHANELLHTEVKHELLNEQMILNILMSLNNKSIYGGSVVSFVDSIDSLKRWATVKKVNLNETKIKSEFFYFNGKFYYLNRKLCEHIAKHGKDDAEYFTKNLGGAEDVYVGYVVNKTKSNILKILKNHIQTTVKLITPSSLILYQKKMLSKFKTHLKQKQTDAENCVDTQYADTVKINECKMLEKNIEQLSSLL